MPYIPPDPDSRTSGQPSQSRRSASTTSRALRGPKSFVDAVGQCCAGILRFDVDLGLLPRKELAPVLLVAMLAAASGLLPGPGLAPDYAVLLTIVILQKEKSQARAYALAYATGLSILMTNVFIEVAWQGFFSRVLESPVTPGQAFLRTMPAVIVVLCALVSIRFKLMRAEQAEDGSRARRDGS